MVLLRKSSSLPLLFILASLFTCSTMAMIRDGEELKEPASCEPLSSIQKWREMVGVNLLDFPSVLTCLIADYSFVPSKIAGGFAYSAVIREGKIFMWGYNLQGQLGNGTRDYCSTPCALPLEDCVTRVALGRYHVLAYTDQGMLYTWGRNSFGNSCSGIDNLTPIQTSIKIDIDQMVIGSFHSMVLTPNGELLAWASQGVYGYSKENCRLSPTPKLVNLPIEPNDRVKEIASYHECSLALTRDGRLFMRGHYNRKPEEILIKEVVKIAVGADFYLTLTSQGEVWAWGKNNHLQLGNESEESSPVRADIPAFIVEIAAGELHAVALTNKGEVFSWGCNWYGQLGLGDTLVHVKPTLVPLQHCVVEIIAGEYHCLVRTMDDKIFAWGLNQQGQLGIGTFVNSSTPVLVPMPDISR